MASTPDPDQRSLRHVANPHRGRGLPAAAGLAGGTVVDDPGPARALFARCPVADTTPILEAPDLAAVLGVGALALKDERRRMGLGSFKALGAGHAVARLAANAVDRPGRPASEDEVTSALAGTTFVCASAGNHGLALAATAPVFGARAVVHVADTVPAAFVERLVSRGATVIRSGADYEAAVAAATDAVATEGWTLLPDSSWPGQTEMARLVMEGYLILVAEAVESLDALGGSGSPPTHVVVQAGVGGLAAAVSALVRRRWGDEPLIVVVEPDAAPALLQSIAAAAPVTARGPVSTMGRLDCKEPSHLALAELARHADHFVTIGDDQCAATCDLLADHDIETTPSGAAGLAALHHAGPRQRRALALDADSRVLAFLTEGPEVGELL